MRLFITNDNIRMISVFLAILIVILLVVIYNQVFNRMHFRKIREAIMDGDKDKAYNLIHLLRKKQPMSLLGYKAQKIYEDKFKKESQKDKI